MSPGEIYEHPSRAVVSERESFASAVYFGGGPLRGSPVAKGGSVMIGKGGWIEEGVDRDSVADVRFARDTLNWVIDLATLFPTFLSLSLSLDSFQPLS